MQTGCTLQKNIADRLPISSITPVTLQDFPDFVACILWFCKCNFRCKYCYNIDLVNNTLKKLHFSSIAEFLTLYQNLLDGVVLSGGECTLFRHLPEFVSYIKQFGYKVKVDTNGSNPKMLCQLLEKVLLDYIALDYKAPYYKYSMVTGHASYNNFFTSLKLLCESNVMFEVRTTVHTDLLDEKDINDIISSLDRNKFTGKYYLQNYMHQVTIGNLKPQTKILDIKKLNQPKNFSVHFRNF